MRSKSRREIPRHDDDMARVRRVAMRALRRVYGKKQPQGVDAADAVRLAAEAAYLGMLTERAFGGLAEEG